MDYLVRDFRMLRNKNIGSRNESKIIQNALPKDFITESGLSSLPLKELSILRQYFADMRLAIMEASRVMRKGATAIYVVGDSNLKGVFIRNSMVVKYLGQSCGLTAVSSDTRVIPANRRYLPPPKSAKSGIQLSSRMAEEVIITFCKQ